MKAVILAAGMARRMRPLSDTCHKTLLQIDGRAIISRIIDSLLANDISDICIVTGYRADQLETFVQTQFPALHFTFVRNNAFATTNNIYSMALALEHYDCAEGILLIESDLVFEPLVLRRLLDSPHPNAALLDRYGIGMDGTVVSVSSDGIITQVIPAALQGSHFDFTDKYKTLNIYKFSGDFCLSTFRKLLTYYARVIDDNCYYELILGILIYMQQVQIHAVILNGERWAELDDPNDLRQAEFYFAPSTRRAHLDSSWGGYWTTPVLDFAFIRNMYFPTPAMHSELRASLQSVLTNYGSAQNLLNAKMAYFLLCDPQKLRTLNGASQLFPILRRRFSNTEVLLPAPTFGEYTRAFPMARSYTDNVGPDTYGVNIRQLSRQVSSGGLVVFVNPNNPTGSVIPTEAIADFAIRHTTTTVLVDESFLDFSDQPSIMSLIDDAGLDNVVVVKSLSKALGVPGIRLGFIYSRDRSFLAQLDDELPIWNINSVAENFLEILLKHRTDLAASLHQTVRDRDLFTKSLLATPAVVEVLPSAANFLLARMSFDRASSDQLVEQLVARDLIYVKDVSAKFSTADCFWRLAVRLPAENHRLCDQLTSLVAGTRVSSSSQARPSADPSSSLMMTMPLA
jgi:histidinol-phosphate/aromatic aminotransferase/cobyric acid decarboxylase-like protein/choline kinase